MAAAMKLPDAITLLKADHKAVKALFDAFEKSRSDKKKEEIAKRAMQALRVHATVEEEIFYPAVRAALKKEIGLVNEADEEHRVAKTLIEDLEKNGAAAEHFEAKFTVLAENVRHHIKEEEGDMFKKVRASKIDLKEIGNRLFARKEELADDEQALQKAERSTKVKPYQQLG